MTIKKVEGGWLVDEQPGGRGAKRFRKTLKTQAEAKQYQAWLKTKVTLSPDWAPERAESRRLKDLITEWYTAHGSTLRSGDDQKKRLERLADAVGNPLADKFDASKFAEYRTRRVSEGVSLANCNREQAYLKAMFNQLAAIGRWSKANPVGKVKPFKVAESELTYLTDAQITDLLTALAASSNPHALPCAKVCLATGARWSEGEQLTRSQVKGGKVQFARTKTDKNRSLPISAELADELSEHYKKHGKQERFFAYCEGAFREAVERAGIELPDGQMTHVLRHTFASHFMQNGGNILTLQRALGHRDLKTTMRYAHLAPDHLLEVLTLNPLAGLNKAKMPADHADPEPNQTT